MEQLDRADSGTQTLLLGEDGQVRVFFIWQGIAESLDAGSFGAADLKLGKSFLHQFPSPFHPGETEGECGGGSRGRSALKLMHALWRLQQTCALQLPPAPFPITLVRWNSTSKIKMRHPLPSPSIELGRRGRGGGMCPPRQLRQEHPVYRDPISPEESRNIRRS